MIYAGLSASSQATPDNYLFNCLRNVQCQPAFFVPLRSLSDLFLYFEFPFGKPTSWLIQLVDCDGTVNELSFCNYLIARRPDGIWYGLFTSVTDDVGDLNQFRLQATFFLGATGYKYFSEQLEITTCDPLMRIESCYPVPDDLTRAYDCNDIYFGTHTGGVAAQGNLSLRYLHFAYVRKGSVIEQSNKMEITLFNSRRAYKNILTRTSVVESERTPKFYKDVLLGIFFRGNVLIDGKEYPLAPSQEIAANKEDKMWEVDILLEEIRKGYFGCSDDACEIAAPECGDNFTDVEITDAGYHLTGGSLADGDTITWTLKDSSGNVIETRTTTLAASNFTDPINLEDNCYTFEWFKNCLCSLDSFPSPTKIVTVGNCSACCDPVVISASVEVLQGNSVDYLTYDRGAENRLDMFLRLVNPASIDAEFDIQISYTLYGVPATTHTVFTIFAGTSFRHFVAGIPTDSVIDSACIYSCSDPNIDTTAFNC